MYGLVARFDLKSAISAASFDRLVTETIGQIRATEPGTLQYAIHEVDGAPLSGVFYEVYVDRAAFEAHEATTHVRRFLEERAQHIDSLRVEFITPIADND